MGQPTQPRCGPGATQVVTALKAKFPAAAEHLDDVREDILALPHRLPREIWRQVWSNNPQERLNKEIRRQTECRRRRPSRDAIIRLVGAVLAEQNDDEYKPAVVTWSLETAAASSKVTTSPETNGSDVTIEAIGA